MRRGFADVTEDKCAPNLQDLHTITHCAVEHFITIFSTGGSNRKYLLKLFATSFSCEDEEFYKEFRLSHSTAKVIQHRQTDIYKLWSFCV